MSEAEQALIVGGWPHCEICGRVLSLVDASYFSCAKHPGERVVLLKKNKKKETKNEQA